MRQAISGDGAAALGGLLDLVQDLAFCLDSRGNVSYANQAACRFFGKPLSGLQGQHHKALFDCQPDPALDAFLQGPPDNGPGGAQGACLLLPPGRERLGGQARVSTMSGDGDPGFLVVISPQIASGDRAEAARKVLEETQARFRAVFESASEAIFIKDKAHRYTQVNSAMARLFGKTPEQLKGWSAQDLFPPGEAERFARQDEKVLQGETVEMESSVVVGGVVTTFHVIKAPLRDSQGRITGMCGFARDVTERKNFEEALKEREHIYRTTWEHAPLGLIHLDLKGEIIWPNQTLSDMLGMSREEIIQAGLKNITHPEDAFSLELMDQLLGGGIDVYSTENRYLKKDGAPLWVHQSCTLIRDAQGRSLSAVVAAMDISERKRADEARKEIETRHRLLTEMSPDAIILHKDGKIIFANPGAALLFKAKSADDLVGMDLVELAHPKDHSIFESRLKMIQNQDRVPPAVYRWKDLKGDTVHIEATARRIRQWEGVVVQSVMRDITERMKGQKALAESEEKYRLLVENQTNLVIKTDSQGRLLFVSPSYCEMFGKTEQKLLGTQYEPVIRGKDRQAYLRALKKLHCPPHNAYLEQRALTKAGWRWLSWNYTAVVDEQGQVTEIIAVGQDIDDHIKAERERRALENQLRQAQKMEAVGTLTSGIAHDFNNILQAIEGSTQVLASRRNDDPWVLQYTSEITVAVQKASELIQRLMAFSRKLDPSLKPVRLNQIVTQTVKILERTLPKMISIHTDLAPDLPQVNADTNQIEQVLMNLGANAGDAMAKGGRLMVHTSMTSLDEDYCKRHLDAQPGEYIKIEIRDTGPGMSPETLEHIFEPFFTTKPLGKGTGLGLSTVYGIIKGHGGHVTCHSTPEQGTSFSIYLPALLEPFAAEPSVADQPEDLTGNGETILVVDDEDAIAQAACHMLQLKGYKTISANSGEMALETFKSHADEIDLVMMDLGMPGMGGQKAMEGLTALAPGVKVLICTGYSTTGSLRRQLERQAAGILAKPYSYAHLLRAIKRILKNLPAD